MALVALVLVLVVAAAPVAVAVGARKRETDFSADGSLGIGTLAHGMRGRGSSGRRGIYSPARMKSTTTVASQVLGAMLMLMSETLLFTVTREGMEPVKNIGRPLLRAFKQASKSPFVFQNRTFDSGRG